MKHLKTFENFKQQEYTIGDLVKLNDGNIAKVIKIKSQNSYIVHLMKNHAFVPEDISVRDEDNGGRFIVDMIQSANNPAMGSDIMQKSVVDANNSMVINGAFPDTPMANVIT